jgi:hypothetical protein
MATNLVSEIIKVLSPSVVSSIASVLRLNPASLDKAIGGAVPALLAALISSLSKPKGAAKLADAVAKQPPDVLSSLASAIGGAGQNALVEQGASALSALLGSKTSAALGDAVGKFSGLSGDGAKGLMGLLGPVALGVLGQEQRDQGLNASGLADLLTAQQSNIMDALPSGLSKYLGDTGILDAVTDKRPKAPPRLEASRPQASRPAATPPSVIPWLLGALALLGLVLLWRYLTPQHETTAETKAPAPVENTTAAEADRGPAQAEASKTPIEMTTADLLAMLQGVKAGDVDIGELANGAVNGLRASLEGITDAASAETGLAGLTKAQSAFDQLDGLVSELTPEKRKILADLFVSIRPSLEQLLDKVLAIPGVSAIIKPAVDAIRSKLDSLVKS